MLGNVKEIEKLYNGGDYTIIDDERVMTANKAFNDYIEKSDIVGNAGVSHIRMELDELITQIAYENERQGFVTGFRCALNLLVEEKSAQG